MNIQKQLTCMNIIRNRNKPLNKTNERTLINNYEHQSTNINENHEIIQKSMIIHRNKLKSMKS